MNDETRCECQETARVSPSFLSWYSKEELKAVNHDPDKCPGDFQIKLYEQKDGVRRWLCSCCHTSGDTLIELPGIYSKEF